MRKVMRDKKHILGIVGAFLVVLFITLLLPGAATAAKNVENTYAVVITTAYSTDSKKMLDSIWENLYPLL